MEGTVDPARLANSESNALVGNPDDVASQIRDRYHPDDRLMLWFDFFVKDNTSVLRAMDDFCGQVIDVLMSTNRDLAATRRFFTTRCNTAPCQPK